MEQEQRVRVATSSMQLDQRKVGWLITGVALGYPTCCIKSFINLEHLGAPDRKLNGTGFVPCAHCDNTKTTQELVDEINRAREPGIPPFGRSPDNHY